MTDSPASSNNGGTTTYRLGRLEDDRKTDRGDSVDLEERVRLLEIEVGKLQERMTLFQMAQAAFTTIASAVAIFFGRMN